MLETRVAKLEADVSNIRENLSEARADIRELKVDTAATKRDVAVILQKLIDIDSNLSRKPSEEAVDTKIASVQSKVDGTKIWFLSILLLSVAMPIIMFLLNIYLQKTS